MTKKSAAEQGLGPKTAALAQRLHACKLVICWLGTLEPLVLCLGPASLPEAKQILTLCMDWVTAAQPTLCAVPESEAPEAGQGGRLSGFFSQVSFALKPCCRPLNVYHHFYNL